MQILISDVTNTALEMADMQNSQFIDTSGSPGTELINYVNLAYQDLYQQIVASKEFYFTTSYSISTAISQSYYSLPDDFYKLDGVDLEIDGNGRYLTLTPFMFKERNKFRNNIAIPVAPFGQVYRYIIFADKIQFIPQPQVVANLVLWYTPEPITLTLTTTLNLPIGSSEYMSLYCACLILAKEETDVTPFDQKRQQVMAQIRESFKDRDQGSPNYVVDDSQINAGAWYPFLGSNGGY